MHPNPGVGPPPNALERMLWIHFLHQGFDLSEPGMAEALYGSPSMRPFAGINSTREPVPANVDHRIGVIKWVFAFARVRDRRLAKNANRLFVTSALARPHLTRGRPLRQPRPCCARPFGKRLPLNPEAVPAPSASRFSLSRQSDFGITTECAR